MRIIETEINDIPEVSNIESKLNLSNKIIEYVQPIFDLRYSQLVKEIKNLKENVENKRVKINKEKIELENLVKDFSKKDKESQLLHKIGLLIQTGLIQENMKNEMSVMLQSFEHMSEDKITNYLNEAIRILGQKFAKT